MPPLVAKANGGLSTSVSRQSVIKEPHVLRALGDYARVLEITQEAYLEAGKRFPWLEFGPDCLQCGTLANVLTELLETNGFQKPRTVYSYRVLPDHREIFHFYLTPMVGNTPHVLDPTFRQFSDPTHRENLPEILIAPMGERFEEFLPTLRVHRILPEYFYIYEKAFELG